jgi:CRP-like cAMP-binding protein
MRSARSGNGLLDWASDLDHDFFAALMRSAELVDVEPGRELQCAGARIAHVWFPISGMLFLSSELDDGNQVNTLGIGCDGAVHASAGIDFDNALYAVSAHLPGSMLRIDAHQWQRCLNSSDAGRSLAVVYSELLFARSQQALVCQLKHDVESRLCYRLLEMDHLQKRRPLQITHGGLAQILGVRRTTVTLMARRLQNAGIVSYRRGMMEIVDRYALREASCPCHKLRYGLRFTQQDQKLSLRAVHSTH